jgi:drug/metabolite transporter (DMT)-like permease
VLPSELVIANLGLLLMIFFWGGFFPLLERLLLTWDVYSVTLTRQILGASILLVGAFFERHRAPLPGIVPWGRILILGGIGVSVGSLLTSVGVMFSSGLSSAIISTTNPIGSALTAAALYRLPPPRGIAFGTLLSVAGGLITVLSDQSIEGMHFRGGEILIVASNVSWTWMSIAAQRWLHGYSQLQITAFTVAAGAFWLLLLLPVVAASGIVTLRIDLELNSLWMVIYGGALPIAFGGFCWNYGVSRIGIIVPSMYSNLLPMAAALVALLLGGRLIWQEFLGAAIILVGVLTPQILALRHEMHNHG